MFDMVQGANIHPYVRQLFSDPSTGSFNQVGCTSVFKVYESGSVRTTESILAVCRKGDSTGKEAG
jgi:hypothetical protein